MHDGGGTVDPVPAVEFGNGDGAVVGITEDGGKPVAYVVKTGGRKIPVPRAEPDGLDNTPVELPAGYGGNGDALVPLIEPGPDIPVPDMCSEEAVAEKVG